uniref:Tc1-like transposase DDE domain-containing protein n=1 Tax=Strigamia maritima TaxID=126957 RepID=T1INI0_STRMM
MWYLQHPNFRSCILQWNFKCTAVYKCDFKRNRFDGAPPHYAKTTRQHLDMMFPGHWIGRGGPVAWPVRSPDLIPLDYFLWDHIKKIVYATEPATPDDLQRRIREACHNISLQTMMNVKQSIAYRAQLCIEKLMFAHYFDNFGEILAMLYHFLIGINALSLTVQKFQIEFCPFQGQSFLISQMSSLVNLIDHRSQ